jgi:hypothetical protein
MIWPWDGTAATAVFFRYSERGPAATSQATQNSSSDRVLTAMAVQLRITELMSRSRVRRRVYIALFAVLAAYQPAKGQESLQLPSLELPKSGIAEGIPNDAMPSEAPSADALSSPLIGRALAPFFKDSVPRTRGAQDITLFRNGAPASSLDLDDRWARLGLSVEK